LLGFILMRFRNEAERSLTLKWPLAIRHQRAAFKQMRVIGGYPETN